MSLLQITLDFETFFKSGPTGFSLRTLTYSEYCTDSRFQVIGVGIAFGDEQPQWIPGPDCAAYFATIDWGNAVVSAWNAMFDMSILHYHYNIHPKHVIDPMSLAAASGLRMSLGGSLAACSEALRSLGYQLPAKGHEILKADGKRYEDFSPAELEAYAAYCLDDVRICKAIYDIVVPEISTYELQYQDMMLQCATNPKLVLDEDLLKFELDRVITLQKTTLDAAAAAHSCTPLQFRAILMSNIKFADLLRERGVEPPMKMSKTTGKMTLAFAKTDQEFIDLQDHSDIFVQTYALARVGNKSSNETTKLERMISMAPRGPLPMCYQISAAHTHRLGSSQKFNCMALSSGRGLNQTNNARRSIMAPLGYKVGSTDASQIEPRVGAVICDERSLIQAFQRGDDPYVLLASSMYKMPYEDIRAGAKAGDMAMVKRRQMGKNSLLSNTYGTGPAGFMNYAKIVAKIDMTEEEAKATVETFRSTFPAIPRMWQTCQLALETMIRGGSMWFGGEHGNMFFADGERTLYGMHCPSVRGPAGLHINFLNLRKQPSTPKEDGSYTRPTEIVYDTVKGSSRIPTRTYGSRLYENLVQHVAFEIIKRQMLLINRKYRIVGNLHDEAMYLVPDGQEEEAKEYVKQCFAWLPEWMPPCYLASETGIAQRWGDC